MLDDFTSTTSRLIRWTLIGAGLACVMLPAAAHSQTELNVVTETRIVGDTSRTRFIADMTAGADIEVFALADPDRIVIDLPEVHFELAPGAGSESFALVSAYRFGLISRGQSRIVLDLAEPVEVADSFVLPAVEGQPARLVIDLVPTSREAFVAAALDYRTSGGTPDQIPPVDRDNGRITVVIDPGHGGIDPGATNAGNVLEKEVVLAFALELADQLRATGNYDVVLTRQDDTFLTLSERVDFARSQHADIFISVHADSFSVASVRGMAVYTVSERASNQMVAEIAAQENRSDILAGMNIHDTNEAVADILIDLARRETKNFSVGLARDLLDQLEQQTRLTGNPHQEAGFAVLMAPDVPSVLVELGFLSNAQDAEILQSDDWREIAATAMVEGIDAFFETRIAGNLSR